MLPTPILNADTPLYSYEKKEVIEILNNHCFGTKGSQIRELTAIVMEYFNPTIQSNGFSTADQHLQELIYQWRWKRVDNPRGDLQDIPRSLLINTTLPQKILDRSLLVFVDLNVPLKVTELASVKNRKFTKDVVLPGLKQWRFDNRKSIEENVHYDDAYKLAMSIVSPTFYQRFSRLIIQHPKVVGVAFSALTLLIALNWEKLGYTPSGMNS